MNVALKSYDTSSLEERSTRIITAGIPSLPRKQEELAAQPPLPKPELSAAQRALIELRSLHGQKHALSLAHLQRLSTTPGGRGITSKQSERGRKTFKTGLLKDLTKNPKSNETVKHLMHQLSELNNISYRRIVKSGGGAESFCSEMTLQSRRHDNFLETGSLADGNAQNLTSEGGAGTPRSHNVMKLIERQILRDLTRHIHRVNKDKEMKPVSKTDTKTHSDELPGGMKVVIKKTTKRDELSAKGCMSGDVTKSRKDDVMALPSINKTAPANMRRRRPEKYEWSLDDSRRNNLLPKMAGVAIQGQSASHAAGDPIAVREAPVRPQKSHTHSHGDGIHSNLPQIQEEPENFFQMKYSTADTKTTRDVGTNVSPTGKNTSPTIESPQSGKVKLPILGKSIGQQKENGAKFIKPSIGEIKRIIHGLYGDYFDFTLDRYYTYEKQLNETKPALAEGDTPLHFVTPAWDDSQAPAASHTLQLFKSASKRSDEPQAKSQNQKLSVPLIRSKYGKAIASINKHASKVPDRHKVPARMTYSQPVMRNPSQVLGELDSFLREQVPNSVAPNTPNENALRGHIAYQVALYHEQIARENRSLRQSNLSGIGGSGERRYVVEEKDGGTSISQFSEDIDRYAQYLEAYLEAKRKHSQERKAKLQELKEKQKDKRQQRNKHLEAVENRDAFLAQVAISSYQPNTPKIPANVVPAHNDPGNDDLKFDYVHEEHRYDQTPVATLRTQEVDKATETRQKEKQAMGTKVYRIFGERKKSASAIRRWVAQAPLPYASRAIKRQVTRSSKGAQKSAILPIAKNKHRKPTGARMMTDLVSRFQVSTRYKLDRDYMASLASGTF